MKIPYGKQEILDEDIQSVVQVLKSDFLTQGPAVSDFEKHFASAVGAQFAVAFNNATAALHTGYKVLKKNDRKKVLVSAITFAASSNCVLFDGGQVDFADIHPQTFNVDFHGVEEKLQKDPEGYQGLILVDFAGAPLPMERFRSLAEKYNLWIMEDAAHAIGASFVDSQGENVLTGSCKYSDLTIFSFHPVKHIATGEGGMVTTNSRTHYEHLLKLRSHGIERNREKFVNHIAGDWYHEMQELGYNYRMSDINAALGLSQLKRLERNIQKRNTLAEFYKKNLQGLPLSWQESSLPKSVNAYHLFVIKTDRRLDLYNDLKQQGVYTQVHYLPVYLHPYYLSLGFRKGLCPEAEAYYENCLSLPMYHSMTQLEQEYVVEKIHQFFKN